MVKLIIWDLDGTLVNSLPSTYDAINDSIEHLVGRRLSPTEIRAHFGKAEDHILGKLVGDQHKAASFERYIEAIGQRVHEIVVFEGITEVLGEFEKKGVTMAICTGRSRRATEVLLQKLGFRALFSEIVAGDEVEHTKPHPEGLVRICRKAGISPAATIMIGDTTADILAGRAAGTKTAGCTWDELATREGLVEANPHYIVDHPRELLKLFSY